MSNITTVPVRTLTVGNTFAEGGTITRVGRVVSIRRSSYLEVFVTLGSGTLEHKRRYNAAGSVTIL